MKSIIEQTGAELKKGDNVVMCFGVGMVNGMIIDIDMAKGVMLLGVPMPFDPTKPLMNIAKTNKQPQKNLGTVS